MDHYESHLPWPDRTYLYICQECGMGTNAESARIRHEITHLPINERVFQYVCTQPRCLYASHNRMNFENHLDSHLSWEKCRLAGGKPEVCLFYALLKAGILVNKQHPYYIWKSKDKVGRYRALIHTDFSVEAVFQHKLPPHIRIDIEGDEYKHQGYNKTEESERGYRIWEEVRNRGVKRYILVRINLHAFYREGIKKDLEMEVRARKAAIVLREMVEEEIADPQSGLRLVYLFYDILDGKLKVSNNRLFSPFAFNALDGVYF